MAHHPTDMRMGSGLVRMVGLDPSNGDVYIFVGKSWQVMKILHWEHEGYVVYYKRLEESRFHPRIFLRQGVGFRSMKTIFSAKTTAAPRTTPSSTPSWYRAPHSA